MCPEACVYYFGLSWWAVWFQFIILVASIPVGVRTAPNTFAHSAQPERLSTCITEKREIVPTLARGAYSVSAWHLAALCLLVVRQQQSTLVTSCGAIIDLHSTSKPKAMAQLPDA